jgi:hypothetical protein
MHTISLSSWLTSTNLHCVELGSPELGSPTLHQVALNVSKERDTSTSLLQSTKTIIERCMTFEDILGVEETNSKHKSW